MTVESTDNVHLLQPDIEQMQLPEHANADAPARAGSGHITTQSFQPRFVDSHTRSGGSSGRDGPTAGPRPPRRDPCRYRHRSDAAGGDAKLS